MVSPSQSRKEDGFTLIEVMITLVVALVILSGLMLNFSSQNKEYRYQNDRIDTVQDMEFLLKFMAEDLRSALISKDFYADPYANPPATPAVNIINAGLPTDTGKMTTSLSFTVWDADASGVGTDKRANRVYTYNGASLKYGRNGIATEIMADVAFFKVFDDSKLTPEHSRAGIGLPQPLPNRTLKYKNSSVDIPGYTILMQATVGRGVVTRYIQVHPLTLVE